MHTIESIGDYIRELREKRNISRAELADRVGISLSHMEKIENGMRVPSMSAFWKIRICFFDVKTFRLLWDFLIEIFYIKAKKNQFMYAKKVEKSEMARLQ